VEGVHNATSALALADKLGVELVAARAVASVLSGDATPEKAVANALAGG
jgi:glycerol-3-phosphate dehydrogenase